MPDARGDGLVEEDLTKSIIGAFFYVYNQLGYGFLESIYSNAMAKVLARKGHLVEREVPIVIYLEGEAIGLQRIDMIVDGKVIVENKSTHDLAVASHRQLKSYVTGSEIQVGLLLHFGPKPEFHRVVATRSPRRGIDSP